MKKILYSLLLLLLSVCCYGQREELYIFGGAKYDIYLGKFNAPPSDPASIWNANGLYGNKANPESIWNVQGTFGNAKNKLSPWNAKSATVPFLFDEDMKDHGTLSIYSTIPAAQFVAEHFQEIIGGEYPLADWYEAIFGSDY